MTDLKSLMMENVDRFLKANTKNNFHSGYVKIAYMTGWLEGHLSGMRVSKDFIEEWEEASNDMLSLEEAKAELAIFLEGCIPNDEAKLLLASLEEFVPVQPDAKAPDLVSSIRQEIKKSRAEGKRILTKDLTLNSHCQRSRCDNKSVWSSLIPWPGPKGTRRDEICGHHAECILINHPEVTEVYVNGILVKAPRDVLGLFDDQPSSDVKTENKGTKNDATQEILPQGPVHSTVSSADASKKISVKTIDEDRLE